MKTSRIVALFAAATLVLSPRTPWAQGAGALPPVVLLHGYLDSPWRWNTALGYLGGVQGFTHLVNPPLATQTLSITQQATSVTGALSSTYANALVAGHSMGGLVARELATQWPTKVLMSVGSPHYGHPALNPFHTAGYWVTITGMQTDLNVVWNNLFQCYLFGAPCYSVPDFAGFVNSVLSIAEAAKQTYFSGPAVDEIVPGSGFLNGFNGTTHQNAEVAVEKIAVVSQLNTWEFNSTLFRAVFGDLTPGQAATAAALTSLTGAIVAGEGLQIAFDADFNDPYYWDLVEGGLKVAAIGTTIAGINIWYNNLIGGWPNDGFVPHWTQSFPGANVVNIVGPAHLEEPSDFGFLEQVSAAGNRNRTQ